MLSGILLTELVRAKEDLPLELLLALLLKMLGRATRERERERGVVATTPKPGRKERKKERGCVTV